VRRFSRERRRALQVLAESPGGFSEEVLVGTHGFLAEMLGGPCASRVRRQWLTETGKMRRGVTIEVKLIRITDAGRMALEG